MAPTLHDNNYSAHVLELIKDDYSTVFATCFSPDEEYLVAANSRGHISVWKASSLKQNGNSYSEGATNTTKPLKYTFLGHLGAIYCILFGENNTLISGGDDGYIRLWNFSLIIDHLENHQAHHPSHPASNITIHRDWMKSELLSPHNKSNEPPFEINGVSIANDQLYAGSGKGVVDIWNLHTLQCVDSLEGHSGSVYCVSASLQRKQLFSGSEDCSIRMWDLSSNECITILRPADGKVITPSEDLHLHENSTIVGALDVDSSGNWLVCGGGERYQSLWNLPAMSITRFLPTAGDGQQCCFTQSEILTVGNEPYIYHWSYAGTLKHRTPCTKSTSLFALTVGQNSEVIAAGGNSSILDIFWGSPHSQTLSFY